MTGRRYDFAMPIARKLDSPLTMICNNGALVRTHDGETHLRHLLPRDTAERVLRATRPWREGAGVVFDQHAKEAFQRAERPDGHHAPSQHAEPG